MAPYKHALHTFVHSLQSDGVFAGSRLAVSHQEAGFPAALQLSLSLLPAHTAMVPAWRGGGAKEEEEEEGGGYKDSRLLPRSIVTGGVKSQVNLMICENKNKKRKQTKVKTGQQ